MKYQYCYEDRSEFFGSKEYEEFEKELKKDKLKEYKDAKIKIDYKFSRVLIREDYISFDELLNVNLKENKLFITYNFLLKVKEVIIENSKSINKLYKELDSIISTKKVYLDKYLEKSKIWNEKYKTYLYLFSCDYEDLFKEIENKEQEDIAVNASLMKEDNKLFFVYNNKFYLLKKSIGESIINEDLDRIELCYINLSEHNGSYMFSLRLCKER